MSSRVIEAAHELLACGRQCALVTIIETSGSTPRRAGTKMLVRDDGSTVGTVGGGCLEADLCAYALEAMRHGKPTLHDIDLGTKSADQNDMLCGGRLKVLVEPLAADEKLVILGGGHISRAIHDICDKLEFRITVTDDRPQFANAERFPRAERTIAAPFETQFVQLGIDANTSVIIVTRGHEYDQLCMEEVLKTPAKFIGMVGSRTKFAVFRQKLREKGVPEKTLDRVVCPVGLGIGAQTPEEIAVSIAAQLVQLRRKPAGPGPSIGGAESPGKGA